MGFMDDMMAAKRTTDSHANLKATEAIAEAQERQAYAAQVQAQQNAEHNQRMLSLAIDEKLDQHEVEFVKDRVFHYEQLLELFKRVKSPILQYQLLNPFRNETAEFFQSATSDLKEIADKREAEKVRLNWSEFVRSVEEQKSAYERSSLFKGGVLEKNLEKLKQDYRELTEMGDSFAAIVKKNWELPDLKQKLSLIQAYEKGDAKERTRVKNELGKGHINSWRLISQWVTETDMAAVQAGAKLKDKKVLIGTLAIFPGLMFLVGIGLMTTAKGAILVGSSYAAIATVLSVLLFIWFRKNSREYSQIQSECKSQLIPRLESAYGQLVSESRTSLEKVETSFLTEYAQIKRDFPEYEKSQTEMMDMHKAFIANSLKKQEKVKNKIRQIRKG